MFPTEIRTLGSGLCVAVATVANAVNSKVQSPASGQCNNVTMYLLPLYLYCRCIYLYLCTAGVPTCTSVLQVYPGLLGLLGFHGTFWLYSGLGLVMAVHGARVIPDNRSDSALPIS